MNQKELKELIEFLVEKDIAEFELERGDVKVRVKRGGEAVMASPELRTAPAPVAATPVAMASAGIAAVPAATPIPVSKDKGEESGLHIVKSPIVGTFYESPSPGSPPFVRP